MSAGCLGMPLSKKLGIKEGILVAALWASENFASLLALLPDGVRLWSDLRGRSLHHVCCHLCGCNCHDGN